jgi:hypothetical protein
MGGSISYGAESLQECANFAHHICAIYVRRRHVIIDVALNRTCMATVAGRNDLAGAAARANLDPAVI